MSFSLSIPTILESVCAEGCETELDGRGLVPDPDAWRLELELD